MTPMRLLLSALCSLLYALTACAQTSGQNVLQKKSASAGFTYESFTLGNSQLIGRTSGGTLSGLTLGTGLSLSGTTLSSTASGGTWGSITGTLSNQTDLQTAIDAKLASATAATTYAPIASPTFTGTVTIPTGASISGYLTTASAASSYQPLDSDLTAIAALSTQTFGRSLLTAATAGTARSLLSLDGANAVTFGSLTLQRLDNTTASITLSSAISGSVIVDTDLLTAARSQHYPDADGTYVLTTNADGTLANSSVTNAMLAGSIAASKVSGTAITAADTGTVTNTMLAGSITPSKITGTAAILGTNTFTGVQLLPDGSAAAPALAFANDTNTGLYSSGADIIAFATAGAIRAQFGVVAGVGTCTLYTSSGNSVYTASGGGAQLGSTSVNASLTPYWTVTAATGRFASSNRAYELALGGDCILAGDAAATFQLGSDSATPITQRICAPDGSGTNITGGSIGLQSGVSTGTGAGGDVFVETSMSGSTGSTANTVQERSRIIGRFKDLTEATATNLASIALASGKVTGGTATITVWASDGTDHQALTSEVRFSAVNKAGTITATVSQTDGTTAASAGTLTVTYDATQSGSAILLRANATSSLTQTILRSRCVITAINGDDTQTVTPQ